MEWQNDDLRKVYEHLQALKTEFDNRRKGAEFKQIFLALAHTFPEHRPKLYAWLAEAARGAKKQGGGARVYRPPVRASGTVSRRARGSGCSDCPDAGLFAETGTPLRVAKVGTPADEAPAAEVTVDDILEQYDDDETLLAQYAKNEGIDIGRATTARGIAQKIADHHNATA